MVARRSRSERRIVTVVAATAYVAAAAAFAFGCSSDPEAEGGGLTPAPSYQPVSAPSQNPLPPGVVPRTDGSAPVTPPPPPKDAAPDTVAPDTAPPPADTGPADAPTG
ncbi:MAG: hypothetical protein IPF92_06785 [Myxococcales bacterium]|nr:hypothetical protein [Myxococcales bacterium]MBL0192747.1 hypothetical protein [Myxococcales bacterium]